MKFLRGLLSVTLLVFIAVGATNAFASSKVASSLVKTSHGLYIQPWFKQSSGDLRQDMAAAQKEGKTLAVFWEQDGCHYCQEMHEVNLSVKDIADYIGKNFYVIQFDLHGDQAVSGWDGIKSPQARLAGKMGVRGTPTILFYRQAGQEVTRMPGYASPPIFKKVFEYVIEEGDKEASLIDWIRAKLTAETKG
jgi:thioredoxin-related protein